MKKLLFCLLLVLAIPPAVSFAAISGCQPTFAFSPLTGERCAETLSSCQIGDLFSSTTGEPCQLEENSTPTQSRLHEYQSKLSDYKQQLIEIQIQFSKEREKIENENIPINFIQGRIQNLTNEARDKIYKVQLEISQLYIDYQDVINMPNEEVVPVETPVKKEEVIPETKPSNRVNPPGVVGPQSTSA